MKAKIVPYLMFNGQAEEAMKNYISLFGGGEIVTVSRYGEAKSNVEWTISDADADKLIHAEFTLAGQTMYCADSLGCPSDKADGHKVALTVSCESEEEINRLCEQLSLGGQVFMPLQDTFWRSKFAVLKDRYGIRWQLDFPNR